MQKKWIVVGLLALVGLGAGLGALGGHQLGLFDNPAAAVEIGAPMPDFTMTDLEGNTVSLSSLAGQVVVLNFCSHKCPFSAGSDPQFAELVNKYTPQGVVFLGIDSHYATPREEIAQYAREADLPFPILKDENHAYADLTGAKRTPEIFIVDRDGKLAYHGAFDSRRGANSPGSKTYTADALAALLAGEPIENPQTRAWGCTIKRSP